jgi:hypothetical protein
MPILYDDEYIDGLEYIGTDSIDIIDTGKILTYRFGKFDVDVILSPDNEFLGIKKIKVNKDFLSSAQKRNLVGYLDVEKYYED